MPFTWHEMQLSSSSLMTHLILRRWQALHGVPVRNESDSGEPRPLRELWYE